MKEATAKGFIAPPEKQIRSCTKGRFQVPIKTSSDHFVVDKAWERKANEDAFKEHKRRELWDKNMLEKKRNQKLLKDRLIEDQMHSSMTKSPKKK